MQPDAPPQGLRDEPPVQRVAVDRYGHPRASYAATSSSIVPSPPTSSGAPNRHALTHSQARSSSGSPTCTSSQSIAAARPWSSTITFPSRRSPCTIVVAVRGGRLREQPLVALLERRARVVELLVRAQDCVDRVGVGRARHLGRIDRVQPREEAAEVVDEVRACARVLVVAQDLARRASRRRRATSRGLRCRARCRRRRRGRRARRDRRGCTRAHRVRFAAASTPGSARAPGRIATQDERLAVRGERPRLARRAAGQLRAGPRSRPRPRTRREDGAQSAQMSTLVPTGMPSTTWSRYSDRPAPVSSPYDQRVMPSVMRVTKPSRRLRSGMFDHTSPSTLVGVVVGLHREAVLDREPLVVVVGRERAVADRHPLGRRRSDRRRTGSRRRAHASGSSSAPEIVHAKPSFGPRFTVSHRYHQMFCQKRGPQEWSRKPTASVMSKRSSPTVTVPVIAMCCSV